MGKQKSDRILGAARGTELERFDGASEITGIRRRFAAPREPLNPFQAVCIGLFIGGTLSHEAYGANEISQAVRHARRLRRNGVGGRLRWLNCGAWARDMWIRDLSRPLGTQPDAFYGSFPADVLEMARP